MILKYGRFFLFCNSLTFNFQLSISGFCKKNVLPFREKLVLLHPLFEREKPRLTAKSSSHSIIIVRGVAQLASALAWGARGRKFESFHPDQFQKREDVQAGILSSFSFISDSYISDSGSYTVVMRIMVILRSQGSRPRPAFSSSWRASSREPTLRVLLTFHSW